MSTTTINITLPTPMKKAVDSQVKAGVYASFSEFVRSSIRNFLATAKPVPYGPGFSKKTEKEILKISKQAIKNRSQNLTINSKKELNDFIRSL